MGELKNQKLKKKLFLKKESAWDKVKNRKQVMAFCSGYKNFLSENKIEREVVRYIVKNLSKNGFKEVSPKAGEKFYKVAKNKVVIAGVIGRNKDKFRIIGSHIDSPRLDLKPNPVFEDASLALFKSHYYGGIKKYQWVNTPLAMHGVVFTKNSKKIEFSYGEKDDEPKFIIPDLLPHLSRDQMKKEPKDIVEGEQLNIVVGNIPIKDKDIKEKVKFTALELLLNNYGISEEDFVSAEIEFVPAGKPIDIGFDNSLIAAYGQDDKVSAYASLQALLEVKSPKETCIGFFVDKEEIGSMGDTGAASLVLENFTQDYIDLFGLKISTNKILEKSISISADVTGGLNPNFKDAHEPNNASKLGYGVSIEKYGGGGGKYSSHDASAEYMHYIKNLLDRKKIPWQTGELGKIDLGGGGTIAMYMSKYGMDCVDAGPAVLGMHSPCELVSKVDIYSAYLLYKEFYGD